MMKGELTQDYKLTSGKYGETKEINEEKERVSFLHDVPMIKL